MDINIHNAIKKMNAATGYNMAVTIRHKDFEPWYAEIYNTEGTMEVEFLERDGGVIASVMHRFNISTAKLTRILDSMMEFMPISPPGGD